jgi:hypothetical protein
MIRRMSEPLVDGGRRTFFGRLAAGGAGLVAGVLGAPVPAGAHEERQTLVRSERGLAWGIAHYRVRRNGANQAATRVVAHLLDAEGQLVGEYVRTRHSRFENERSPYAQSEIKTRRKRYLNSELIQLAWGAETVEFAVDQSGGLFRVKYNGALVGGAKVSRYESPIDPALTALLQLRPDLFRVGGAISEDLDDLFPEPAEERPTECFCCDDYVQCGGATQSCVGYAFLKSQVCRLGMQCIGSRCWNSYCIGCCDARCDTVCAADDFVCAAYMTGYSCSCGQICP